jgi:amidase
VGLVPLAPNPFPFLGFGVNGPMARSVADTAFLLSVMAGDDPRDPGCDQSVPQAFAGPLERDLHGTRVAWCPDLGRLPLDPRVRGVLDSRRRTFEDLGCIVEDAHPDLGPADRIFLTLRAFRTAATWGPLLQPHRAALKPEMVAEIEAGQALSAAEVSGAMMRHSQLLDRLRRFQQQYPYFVCAVNQVPPFDASIDWPKAIDGVPMTHYIDWMQSAYWVSTTFCPALSVPAGFTRDGLPVGLQIVGRRRDDMGVLQLGHAFEQATGVGRTRPALG